MMEPKLNDNMHMVIGILESTESSLKIYENAKCHNCGYGDLTKGDSKDSIQRRITVAREELLKISKRLDRVC